jgi:hypothetical protein
VASLPELLGVRLQIGHIHPSERLVHRMTEPGDLGAVGTPGMHADLGSEPEFNEGRIVFARGAGFGDERCGDSQSICRHAVCLLYQITRTG